MVWLNLLNGYQVTQATYVAAVMSVVAVHFPIRNEVSLGLGKVKQPCSRVMHKIGKIGGSMSSSEPDVPIFAAMLRSVLGDRVSESATFPAMWRRMSKSNIPMRPTARFA